MAPVMQPVPPEARFWKHVDIRDPDDCWEWQAGKASDGYGRFWWGGGKTIAAHRAAWMLTHGPLPENVLVLHKCDNKPCVNPRHLFTGTQSDNIQDALSKDRLFRPRGELQGRAVLTEGDVREIRRRLSRGDTQLDIARDYGVGRSTVQHIKQGTTWGWLEPEEGEHHG